MQNRIAMLGCFCVIALLLFTPVSKLDTRTPSEPCGVALLMAMAPRKVVWEDSPKQTSGFTLIEMSIVLVIIGLIAGVIVVGQDLIGGAAVRAQISQIQRYQAAVHTFQMKYNNFLPGDIPNPYAAQFGFQTRGQYAGQGDGNGYLEGNWSNASGGNAAWSAIVGETGVFWVDLSTANLIDGGFNTASTTNNIGAPVTSTTTPAFSAFYPVAKIGNGNYIYVYSFRQANYFGLSAPTQILGKFQLYSSPALSVKQAYSIDTKIDDGLPQSGNVTALYINYSLTVTVYLWAGSGGLYWADPYTAATPGTSTSCYDNGSSSTGAAQQYSTEQNGGNGINCALSFKFQ